MDSNRSIQRKEIIIIIIIINIVSYLILGNRNAMIENKGTYISTLVHLVHNCPYKII